MLFFLRVGLLVVAQRARSRESLATSLTDIGLLSGVNPLMYRFTDFVFELLMAKLTFKSIPRHVVNILFMYLQFLVTVKQIPAS